MVEQYLVSVEVSRPPSSSQEETQGACWEKNKTKYMKQRAVIRTVINLTDFIDFKVFLIVFKVSPSFVIAHVLGSVKKTVFIVSINTNSTKRFNFYFHLSCRKWLYV